MWLAAVGWPLSLALVASPRVILGGTLASQHQEQEQLRVATVTVDGTVHSVTSKRSEVTERAATFCTEHEVTNPHCAVLLRNLLLGVPSDTGDFADTGDVVCGGSSGDDDVGTTTEECACDLDRRHASELTAEEFEEQYARRGRPVILRGYMDSWEECRQWVPASIRMDPEHEWGRANGTEQTAAIVEKRASNAAVVRAMFEEELAKRSTGPASAGSAYLMLRPAKPGVLKRALLSGYSSRLPQFLARDFLRELCDVQNETLPKAWVLPAVAGSGSSWHLDPFNTSAWNALLFGRKRWAMYPPAISSASAASFRFPPLIGPMEDVTDTLATAAATAVAAGDMRAGLWGAGHRFKTGTGLSPVQYVERVLPTVLAQQKQPAAENSTAPPPLPMQCVQHPGEIIFVPSGWWHQVLNLDATGAVTENFANEHNVHAVLAEMRMRGPQAPRSAACVKQLEAVVGELNLDARGSRR
jgi:hypothetical protein